MEHIKVTARKYALPGGRHIVEPDPIQLKESIAAGESFVAYGIDTRMLDVACRAGLAMLTGR